MRHLLHFHRIHLIRSELNELYVNILLQTFAISMIWVFIPIYLLVEGFSFNFVLGFLIAQWLGFLIFSPISAKIANRFGFKHIMLLRAPLLILILICFSFLSSFPLPLHILAIFIGISDSLYWVSFNCLFARNSEKAKRAKEVGLIWISRSAASLIAPLAGGLIAYEFGFHILFMISTVILILSVISLFFTPDKKPHIKFSMKRLISKKYFKFYEGFFASGLRNINSVYIWPIFVFTILQTTAHVGFALMMAQAGVLFFTTLVEKVRNIDRRRFLKIGAVLTAIIWLMRLYVRAPYEIYLISLMAGITTLMIIIPFDSFTFDKAAEEKSDEFIVFREISLATGRIFMLLVLLFVASKFLVGFSLASLSSLWFLFL